MDYQSLFVICFVTTVLLMKLTAVLNYNPGKHSITRFLFTTPLFTPYSLKKNILKDQSLILRIHLRYILFTMLFVGFYQFYQFLFEYYTFPLVAKAYLLTFFVYLVTNYLGVTAQAMSLITREIPIDIHNQPYLSKNLNEFWGLRWNTWIRDWLHIFTRKWHVSAQAKVLSSFLISGLFHEIMINLPFSIYSKQFYFGTMMLYFGIQGIGIMIDRQISMYCSNQFRRIFMWIIIVLPSPLFINKAFITFFNL